MRSACIYFNFYTFDLQSMFPELNHSLLSIAYLMFSCIKKSMGLLYKVRTLQYVIEAFAVTIINLKI